MPTRRRLFRPALFALSAALAVGLLAAIGRAATPGPAPAWTATLNVAELAATPAGAKLLDHFKAQHPQLADGHAKLTEALGLDPMEDIQRLTVSSRSGGDRDLTMTALLHQSTGNVEGLMLAMPGYQSEDIDDQTLLHSFLVEDKHGPKPGSARPGRGGFGQADGGSVGRSGRGPSHAPMRRLWVAMPVGPDGNHRVAAAFDRQQALDLTASLATSDAALGAKMGAGRVMHLDVFRVPDELRNAPADQPGSAVLKALQSGSMWMESDEDMTLTVALEAASPARARQIGQLMRGAVAMVQLAALEDPKAASVAHMLASLNVVDEPAKNQVYATLTVDPDRMIEFLNTHAPHHGQPRFGGESDDKPADSQLDL
ncbi:MAG: hypothetical protein AAF823_05565 [Planctomycetota bacterium]